MNSLERAVNYQQTASMHNAAVTATSNSTGVDITDYDGLVEVSFAIPVLTGTPTSFDVAVQTSDVLGSGYVAATKVDGTTAAVTGITAATVLQKLVLDTAALKKYVRLAFTMTGGTSPSAAVNANLRGMKKVL
jgi:hypothetical protein